ncbi:MAG: hypothetical protein DRN68_01755 [Thaumarchaeota archaeon]|nr:MAG: hypothetical protein DRN68_01755 [Nitrososphaerota archaeon]HDD56865.1 hypothetical protein [Nitrososphaeria archaeon]
MEETFLVRVKYRGEAGYREVVGWLLRHDSKRLIIKPLGKDGEERVSKSDLEDLEIMGAVYED